MSHRILLRPLVTQSQPQRKKSKLLVVAMTSEIDGCVDSPRTLMLSIRITHHFIHAAAIRLLLLARDIALL